jgi:hypothetical protein
LIPIGKVIEARIEGCRLLRECLKKDRPGQTGFSHNPFGVEYADGTQIVGRIPNRDGKGVKGQHQRDLLVDEGQDYPDPGYTELQETVMKDDDFTYQIYGVHRGARGGEFSRRAAGGVFNTHSITAMQRPTWSKEEKEAAIDIYGGVNSPDYRRNILGEPGAASSPIFVIARLMACVDQNPESYYNTSQYVEQTLRWEDFAELGVTLEQIIDLPYDLKSDRIIAGVDLGLTNSPTVCSIFAEIDYKAKGEHAKRKRLALIRRITLERFKSKEIRQLCYQVWKWRQDILGIGIDITGLGFPMFQEMESDESYPEEFKQAVRGWKFNEKIEYDVEQRKIEETDMYNYALPEESEVVKLTVIEATTNYLREWVDSGELLLPMDREVVEDLLAENIQRINDVSRLTGSKKPNRFHILDSFRMASLIDKLDRQEVSYGELHHGPILDGFLDQRFL